MSQSGIGPLLAVWPSASSMADFVRDFGGYGDGVTDNTTKLRQALTALDKAGGGTLYIPRGTYLINGQILLPYPRAGTAFSNGFAQQNTFAIVGDGPGNTTSSTQPWSGTILDFRFNQATALTSLSTATLGSLLETVMFTGGVVTKASATTVNITAGQGLRDNVAVVFNPVNGQAGFVNGTNYVYINNASAVTVGTSPVWPASTLLLAVVHMTGGVIDAVVDMRGLGARFEGRGYGSLELTNLSIVDGLGSNANTTPLLLLTGTKVNIKDCVFAGGAVSTTPGAGTTQDGIVFGGMGSPFQDQSGVEPWTAYSPCAQYGSRLDNIQFMRLRRNVVSRANANANLFVGNTSYNSQCLLPYGLYDFEGTALLPQYGTVMVANNVEVNRSQAAVTCRNYSRHNMFLAGIYSDAPVAVSNVQDGSTITAGSTSIVMNEVGNVGTLYDSLTTWNGLTVLLDANNPDLAELVTISAVSAGPPYTVTISSTINAHTRNASLVMTLLIAGEYIQNAIPGVNWNDAALGGHVPTNCLKFRDDQFNSSVAPASYGLSGESLASLPPIGGHLILGSKPPLRVGAGGLNLTGINASLTSATLAPGSNDNSGMITFVVGAAGFAGDMVTVNFARSFGSRAPFVVLTPAVQTGATFEVTNQTATGFHIATNTTLTALATYIVVYHAL